MNDCERVQYVGMCVCVCVRALIYPFVCVAVVREDYTVVMLVVKLIFARINVVRVDILFLF